MSFPKYYYILRYILSLFNKKIFVKYNYDYICTLALSRKYLSDLPSKGLDLVCEALNYKMGYHHNALDDAIASAEVFLRIKDKFNLKDEDIKRRGQYDWWK